MSDKNTSDLAGFWREHSGVGFHRDDERSVQSKHFVDWTLEESIENAWSFRDQSLRAKLHRNLVPEPFVGNLELATVFVLMLNPGIIPANYLEQHGHLNLARLAQSNLSQDVDRCIWLDPLFSWTGAFGYWAPRFARIVREVAERRGVSAAAAGAEVAGKVAIIQACPYHSDTYPGPWTRTLPSADAAIRWVRSTLRRRADAGDAVVIVTRSARTWGLDDSSGILVRPPTQARGSRFQQRERAAIVEMILRTPAQ